MANIRIWWLEPNVASDTKFSDSFVGPALRSKCAVFLKAPFPDAKKPQLLAAVRNEGKGVLNSGFLHEAGLDGFDRNPHALGAAVWQLDLDPLQIGAEQAGGQAGDVCTDAATLLGLTFTVDDLALGRAFTGDCANSCHGVS